MERADVARLVEFIESNRAQTLSKLKSWCSMSSTSFDTKGIEDVVSLIERDFSHLGGRSTRLRLDPAVWVDDRGTRQLKPVGRPLSIVKRGKSSARVLLSCHCDTVLPVTEESPDLVGPGVADGKGGIAVILACLEGFEHASLLKSLGWEVFINTDEEVGSPSSKKVLKEVAARNSYGLVFEPGFLDGEVVGNRGGSSNYAVTFQGKSAHVGRNPEEGRSAISGAARLTGKAEVVARKICGVRVNVGFINGGGPLNRVPDRAVIKLNVRSSRADGEKEFLSALNCLVKEVSEECDLGIEVFTLSSRPPKPLDERSQWLLEQLRIAGAEIGVSVGWKDTAGVSDSNLFALGGLPVIDGLGPIGGKLHDPDEFVLEDTVIERAKLVGALLLKLSENGLGYD